MRALESSARRSSQLTKRAIRPATEPHNDARRARATANGTVMQQLSATLANLERDGVLISDRDAVVTYLAGHPDLLPIVEEVAEAASAQLGDRAELSLEIYRDPEIRDVHLALYARQSPYEPGLFDTIRRISEEHWKLPRDTSGWFYLTTDHRLPHRLRNGV